MAFCCSFSVMLFLFLFTGFPPLVLDLFGVRSLALGYTLYNATLGQVSFYGFSQFLALSMFRVLCHQVYSPGLS